MEAPELPNITFLHLLISVDILKKDSLLAGEEIRFLRKMSALSQAELAEIMGVDSTRVSKWENDTPIGKESDRLLRVFCLLGMTRQFLDGNDIDGMREISMVKAVREMDVQKLLCSIEGKSHGPKDIKVKNNPNQGEPEWFIPGCGAGNLSEVTQ